MKNAIKLFLSVILVTSLSIGFVLNVYAGEDEIDRELVLTDIVEESTSPIFQELSFLGETELKYAECFKIYNYEGGYTVIDIPESGTYFVAPEGGDIPEEAKDMIILQKPLNRIYLAATSAMALFSAIDGVGNIRLSGADASGWYIDAAVNALAAGEMLYAGKYSEPDYELLLGEDCNLAIESTMIYHTPKVKEMIEDLEIPVFVDRSSYESHPLGKTEWVKVYAELVDKQEMAAEFFDQQASVIEELKDFPNTEKTIAFFYVNTDGSIVIRNPKDFIPAMLEIAGGRYAFRDLQTVETSTSFSITMEEFYTIANTADYIIYNGSINSPIESIADLIGKDSLFAEFKAVKEGNVWTVGKEFYQHTDIVGQMIKDVNQMLTGDLESPMTFLNKVE